jgi:hypothetical protein
MTCATCGSQMQPIIGRFALCPKCDQKPEPAEFDLEVDDFWLEEPTNPGIPCPHDLVYTTTHGNVTGDWCQDCGRLLP